MGADQIAQECALKYVRLTFGKPEGRKDFISSCRALLLAQALSGCIIPRENLPHTKAGLPLLVKHLDSCSQVLV